MPIKLEYVSSNRLVDRCRALLEATKPTGVLSQRAQEDYRLIVSEDHYEMLHRGVDRYGRPRASLAPATLKQKNRGSGPSLIPRFWESRFVHNVQIRWREQYGVMTLVKSFIDILSKSGRPFVKYHLDGASKPGTRWVLPRRDVGGVTPAGFYQLKARFAKFVGELARYRKGR